MLILGGVVESGSNINSVYEYDPDYNIFADPQLDNLKDYIGNFMHSNNADHTKELIKKFYDKQSKVGGSPAYIIGRIIGGLLDPSSIFAFTKAGSFLMTGSRLKRAAGFGGTAARLFDAPPRPVVRRTKAARVHCPRPGGQTRPDHFGRTHLRTGSAGGRRNFEVAAPAAI